ncbi:hypothetical protein [Rhodococcus opacus]|uniref:hypothetical protein n=1 Tax=Rhodococcus opacus TaxID=37919 RepID=UPI0035AECCBF
MDRASRRGQAQRDLPRDSYRIAENFDIFDFALREDELARIDALDLDRRGGPDPDERDPSLANLAIPEP